MKKIIQEFVQWILDDGIPCLCDTMANAVIEAYKIVICALLSPIWILPFVYWYFFVRNNREEQEDERE